MSAFAGSQIMSALDINSPIRVAQYLRMSTENQRYSTENQQNAIAEYAEKHDYVVVASYIDAGKSGLSLKGRDALKQLLSDALATPRAFDAILVLDVSRWDVFKTPTKLDTTSSCVGRQGCASSRRDSRKVQRHARRSRPRAQDHDQVVGEAEAQLNGVLDSTAGLYGDLQGIAGRAMPEIEGLDLLMIEAGSARAAE